MSVDNNYVSILEPECSLQEGGKSTWGRLYGSALALAVSQLSNRAGFPIVVIVKDLPAVTRLMQEFNFYFNCNKTDNILCFPDWEILPYDFSSPCQDIISERLATLAKLPSLNHVILVVSVSTLMHRLMPKDFLLSHSLILRKNQWLDINVFRKHMNECGYTFGTQVIEHGDIAVRGSLIDLYPMGASKPYRIDMLDNEIDSIRSFDPESQRSLDTVTEINILPAQEVALADEHIDLFKSNWHSYFGDHQNSSPIYRDVSCSLAPAGIEYYLPLFYQQTDNLFDYLPDDSITVFDDGVMDAAELFWQDIKKRYEHMTHDSEYPILPPEDVFLNPQNVLDHAEEYRQIHITQGKRDHYTKVTRYNTTLLPNLKINGRSAEPLLLLKQFIKNFDGRILIVAESFGRREVLSDLLRQHHIRPVQVSGWAEFINGESTLALTVAPLDQGLQLGEPKIALISESKLFSEQTMRHRQRHHKKSDPESVIRSLTELKLASPVVHEYYGVGRYSGLVTLDIEDVPIDFMLIEYADHDKLYVPISSLDLISRFTSTDTEHAPLHRLGSGQWGKAKQKAAQCIYDVAAELLELQAQRMSRPCFKFELDEDAYRSFVQEFPYIETSGQMDAIEAVISDMTEKKPMDRLICGDAGFGKTEVAMRAAFIATQNNKQVAVLVPTTLLGQQIYENFKDRYTKWPVHIELLTRFQTVKQQKIILQGISDGTVDIVIGTHKLIQKDIKFSRLGLLIIDEEHRFGVRQKERFKTIRAEIDMLTLTATPIPRTLNMALSGIRDFSIITTPPARRLPVKTFIHQWDDRLLKEAILREVKRGGQVYVLNNKIKTIEETAKHIAEFSPNLSVQWAHGQMPGRLLEQVMLDFHHKRFNVLVCTTIIETGIDVPNANTIIIDRADKFGLAQIYQLRGRVGRSHHQAYAYLMIPEKPHMTEDALKRLDAIEALEDLGIGFTLASHDLEIRGTGEILGERQSGHIQEIGYGLYMDLLNRAVAALKSGQQVTLDRTLDHGVEIDLHIPALLPEDYIPDINMRLVMYKRIASVKDKEELQDIKVEIIDRFGLLPEFANNLFRIAELKLLSQPVGIKRINIGAYGGNVQFNEDNNLDLDKVLALINKNSGTYKLNGQDKLRINKALPEPDDRFAMLPDLIADII